MNRDLKKAQLTAVFAAFALLISFFAYFAMDDSMAWFAKNRRVAAGGMAVHVDAPSDLVTVECFQIAAVRLNEDPALAAGTDKNIYDFSKTEQATKMKVYSPVDSMCQVLFKLTLKSGVERIQIKALSRHTGGYPTGAEIAATGNSMSLIVQFCQVPVDAGGTYYTVVGANAVPLRFASVNETDGRIQAEFTGAVDNVYQTPSGQVDREVYLLLDYYPASAEYMRDLSLGVTDENGQFAKEIEFLNDFYFEVSEAE